MTNEEYNGMVEAIDDQYAKSNNTKKVGDILWRGEMKLIIVRIGVGRSPGGYPECVYACDIVDKTGIESIDNPCVHMDSDGNICIWQSSLTGLNLNISK